MSTLAKMGFVGFVRFAPPSGTVSAASIIPTTGISVRVTSADVKLSQEINYPDVVDNKIDQTIYGLGPAQVGGAIQFPLVHEGNINNLFDKTGANCTNGAGTSLVEKLWKLAADRDAVGRMQNVFDCQIRYADNLAYVYPGCLVNQMTFTINQGEPVNVSIDVIGGANATGATGTTGISTLRKEYTGSDNNLKMLAPARIVTWNDAIMTLWKDDTGIDIVKAEEIRQFTCSINNNVDRFYTLNGRLAPQDIAAKKREISGTLDVMGHNYVLSNWTETNEDRFTAPSGIAFGYKLGNSSPNQAYWATGLYGVMFEIEEVSLSTGLLETKTKWRAMGDCTQSFLATKLGSTNVSTPLGRDSDFGTGITGAYPSFGSNNTP